MLANHHSAAKTIFLTGTGNFNFGAPPRPQLPVWNLDLSDLYEAHIQLSTYEF
jgi:hypothetical protein